MSVRSKSDGGIASLEQWARSVTKGYNHVDITDMSSSWKNGLAFSAVIHHFRPDLINYATLTEMNVYENNLLAFSIAEQLGIPSLLDARDMCASGNPDQLSIITYVAQLRQYFKDKTPIDSYSLSGATHHYYVPKISTSNDSSCTAEPGDDAATDWGAGPGKRISNSCAVCAERIFLLERLMIDGRFYHRLCFRCVKCDDVLKVGLYRPSRNSATGPGYECLKHDHQLAKEDSKSKLSIVSKSGEVLNHIKDDAISEDLAKSSDSEHVAPSNLGNDSTEKDLFADRPLPPIPPKPANIDELCSRLTHTVNNSCTEQAESSKSGTVLKAVNGAETIDSNSADDDDVCNSISDDSCGQPVCCPTEVASVDGSCIPSVTDLRRSFEFGAIKHSELPECRPAAVTNTPLGVSGAEPSDAPTETDSFESCDIGNKDLIIDAVTGSGNSSTKDIDESSSFVSAGSSQSKLNEPENDCDPPKATSDQLGNELTPIADISDLLLQSSDDVVPSVNNITKLCDGVNSNEDFTNYIENSDSSTIPKLNIQQCPLIDHDSLKQEPDLNEDARLKPLPPPRKKRTSRTPSRETTPSHSRQGTMERSKLRPAVPPPPAPRQNSQAASHRLSKAPQPVPRTSKTLQKAASALGDVAADQLANEVPSCEIKDDLIEYPDDLNPFGDEGEKGDGLNPFGVEEDKAEGSVKETIEVDNSKPLLDNTNVNYDNSKNPFGDDDDDEDSDNDSPVEEYVDTHPGKRASLPTGNVAVFRPDVKPRGLTASMMYPSSDGSLKPSRKHRPAPPVPPPPSNAALANSQSARNYGKSRPAPPRPMPQKREIRMERNLSIAEVQDRLAELDRQQSLLEIKAKEVETRLREAVTPEDGQAKEYDKELLNDWLTLLNEKNSLVRQETEFVYIRRELHLDELHADIEYQLRCLAQKPDSQKTKDDMAQEEALLVRLLEVVEEKNALVDTQELERVHRLDDAAGTLKDSSSADDAKQKKKKRKLKLRLKKIKKDLANK